MSTVRPLRFYEFLSSAAQRWPEKESFRRRLPGGELRGRSYAEMKRLMDQLAAGLIQAGLQVGDRVLLLCDTSPNWLIADAALVSAGGVSTPRGTDVTDDDLNYIIPHSECRFALVQKSKDRQRLEKMRGAFPSLERIWVIEDDRAEFAGGAESVGALLESGQTALAGDAQLVQRRVAATDPNALATLIYTSGTTGAPKGVMLNQTGWIQAIYRALDRIAFRESDRVLSLLPPWHAFERTVEYACAARGIDFLTTNIGSLKQDLVEFRPTVFPSVPRIWESVYNGIMAQLKKGTPGRQRLFHFFLSVGEMWAARKAVLLGYDPQVERPNFVLGFLRRLLALIALCALMPLKLLSMLIFKRIHGAVGGKLRVSVSGGSALPAVVDRFLQAIGIPVVEGYGLTETSAIISTRDLSHPTALTVGTPLEGYQLRIKDESGVDVKSRPGARGTLWVKSDQILMGYYKRPELNDLCFDRDGFFDTGDIMMMTYRGELRFAGRAKDTIALGGGENVEPVPIEDKLIESEFIDQVMVVGDDRKSLGALIVPNFDRVRARVNGAPADVRQWNEHKDVRQLFRGEITRLISKDTGFKSFETIPGNCFYVAPRNFDLDTEMTRTLKMKRPVIKDNFAPQINAMYE
ncbi:MAG: AMP-binding protein [Leptospirales bacterium]|nr:AMP-binding protein [Leptospirales bacterium]